VVGGTRWLQLTGTLSALPLPAAVDKYRCGRLHVWCCCGQQLQCVPLLVGWGLISVSATCTCVGVDCLFAQEGGKGGVGWTYGVAVSSLVGQALGPYGFLGPNQQCQGLQLCTGPLSRWLSVWCSCSACHLLVDARWSSYSSLGPHQHCRRLQLCTDSLFCRSYVWCSCGLQLQCLPFLVRARPGYTALGTPRALPPL
jgi:hypothetical protein